MKNVFIVEDSSVQLMRLEKHLKNCGLNVVGTAAGADEAVQKVLELKPDLVFMDIIIKGERDGIDAAKEITERAGIPIVFVTSRSGEDFVSRSLQVSPYAYLLKPIDEDQLRVTLEIVDNRIKLEKKLLETGRERERLLEMLSESNRNLMRSNRELDEYASVVAHDLQEPLRKIKMFGDLLKGKSSGMLDEKGQDYLNRMQKASMRMNNLVTDLLLYARLTSEAKPFALVDLGATVAAVVSDMEAAISESGGRVETGKLPSLEADPTQMSQLFQNLISNAVKFRRAEEPPVVKVGGSQTQNDRSAEDAPTGREMCRITVEDNGIGFDERHTEKIFGIFQRLHGKDDYEGTGIGLAVCWKIVQRHDGRIAVRSIPGKGTKFTITLPVRQNIKENQVVV